MKRVTFTLAKTTTEMFALVRKSKQEKHHFKQRHIMLSERKTTHHKEKITKRKLTVKFIEAKGITKVDIEMTNIY